MSCFRTSLNKGLIIVAIITGLLFSCGTKEKGVEVTALKPVVLPDTNAGVISFVSGDVTLTKNGESNPAESGDVVTRDSSIKTGAGASCEITLGDTAVVSIEADTICEIKTLTLDKKSEVGIEVALGSILCKVKKLTENDSFNIRTDSAVCGVRGTEFLVEKNAQGETLVAVKSGRVALLPATVNPDNLENYAELSYTEIVQTLERLESLAPSITENQELVVKRDTFAPVEEAYATLEKIAEKAINKETITQAEITGLKKASDNAAGRALDPETVPVTLTDTNKQKLAAIDTLVAFRGAGSGLVSEGAPDASKEKIELVKLNIKATPGDAEILVNGDIAGTGKVSLLVSEGTDMALVVRSAGYIEKALRIVAKEGSDAEYRIELERKTGEPVKEITASEAETTQQPIADTIVSSTESKQVVEEKAKTEVAKLTVKDKETTATVETVKTDTKEVADKVKTEDRSAKPEKTAIKAAYQVAHTTIIGSMSVTDDKVILADNYGIVTCADTDGNRLWTLSTDNNPNENSYPAVIGGNVYFSGAQELVIINAGSGALISKRKLDSGSTHIFGRHVVKFGSNGLFPKDNGVEIINLANGNVLREIAIPKKSSMTPTVFDKDKILIVDQEGTFLFINGTTGAIEAEVRTNAIQPIGLAVTVVKDKAFTAGRNGTVICVDLSNRTLVWEKSLLAERKISVSNDLETGAGELYAYSNQTLYALSQSTGEAIFPPVSGLSGPPLYFGGSLYYGTVDKKLVIANGKTGRIANSIELDQKITAKPVFGAGGTIFVGTNSGAVYELDPSVFKQ